MTTVPAPRLPNPLTPETIEGLMKARPYWDSSHPRAPLYRRVVRRGFEIMYPGPTRHDAIGRRIDDPPHPPEKIAHLVAKENREIEELERGFDERERGNGAVHVQSHAREGGKVEVSDYWRSRPGEGSGAGDGSDMPKSRNLLDDTENARDENDPGDTQAGTDDGKSGDSLPAPDTRDPVDPNNFYRKLDFDPNGESEWEAFRRRPWDAIQARIEHGKATDVTRAEYPSEDHHNNEADAFRHAYWSLEVARQLGQEAAKEFGDAHERSDSNPTPERLMDLYNNKIGRDLALDPENADRDSLDVIREAIREGKLRTSPFQTNEPPSPLPDRAPGLLYRPPGGQRR